MVNTSPDFVNPSGLYQVYDIATKTLVASGAVSEQPDSITISADCTKAAIIIKNERDEDLDDGDLHQLPGRSLDVLTLSQFDDPSEDGIAVVTFQENNAIAIIDLNTQTVLSSFSSGTVDLTNVRRRGH